MLRLKPPAIAKKQNYLRKIMAFISFTAVFIFGSVAICAEILSRACMIVVWSLPPNMAPIVASGKASISVII